MSDVRREGFSLMEVILAMSILLGGVVVLGRLAAIGAKHARDSEDLASAQLLCEARMMEILAGITPAEAVEDEPLEEAPDWVVTQQLLPIDKPGLLALSVTVTRAPDELNALPSVNVAENKEVSVTLVRWMLDPAISRVSAGETSPAFPSATPGAAIP